VTQSNIRSIQDAVSPMRIIEDLLPYTDLLKKRDPTVIDIIVFHCTELPTLAEAREAALKVLRNQIGNSGHYYIDKDGQIYRYVEDDHVAHHVIGHNETSLGIELVNTGRYPNWFSVKNQIPEDKYTEAQILSAIELMSFLKNRYPNITKIMRHSDLDTRLVPADDDPDIEVKRRIDPGPLFPWNDILREWENITRSQT